MRVDGTVQGVGFRPYVFRLAQEAEVSGWVLNDEHGVLLEVEGHERAVAGFLDRLPAEAPPLASVERVESRDVAATGDSGFRIVASERGRPPAAPVSPDAATCEDCLRELFDPADRRHRYPFVNCTNCGPRFTIVRGVPYDRPATTMAGFEMCARCRAEYEDPSDRRFHAQPNACPDCGPRARLTDSDGRDVGLAGAIDAVAAAAAALTAGSILAVKGLGGYHLACRADDEGAASALRARKHREDKPFALMAADVHGGRRAGRALGGGPRAAHRARAPDRAGAAARSGSGGERRGSALARAWRDAALLAAPPPAAGRCGRAVGHDQRQRVR